MEGQETQVELTPEQLAAKKEAKFWADLDERQAAIQERLGKEVYPITVRDLSSPGEYVVGFAHVPDLMTQLRLIDQSAGNENGFSLEACSKALESLIIVSETDDRITSKKDLNYWKGACATLAQFLTVAQPVLKKK